MIEQAFILAMIVLFAHTTTWNEGIFEDIRKIIPEEKEDGSANKWSKPIYNCPICMTPWWGTLFLWIIWGVTPFNDWRVWLAVIGCASGINVFSVIAIYIKDYCKSRTFEEKGQKKTVTVDQTIPPKRFEGKLY